jgi:hypothetical protein
MSISTGKREGFVAAEFLRRERLREAMATRAPFFAIASLMALPMPVPPPVTSAIFPVNSISVSASR